MLKLCRVLPDYWRRIGLLALEAESQPAPPELSTGALETKTGRDLSSQVVNNSRFASILIRLAHVYV